MHYNTLLRGHTMIYNTSCSKYIKINFRQTLKNIQECTAISTLHHNESHMSKNNSKQEAGLNHF